MLAWGARARTNPNFEVGERQYRLEIARLARQILEKGTGEPLAKRIDALGQTMGSQGPPALVPGRSLTQLRQWAVADDAGLALALAEFDDPGASPAERVGRFVQHLQARARDGDDGELLGLVLGSLFNFATSPGELPMLRMPAFNGLADLLGEPPPRGAAIEQYEHHIGFAARVHDRLAGAGIPVRDMIDTEALILVLWDDREFWLTDDDGRRPRKRAPEHYLAASAIYRDEAPYLAEWIEFHRLVGFERFYLYDNRSEDNHLEVLAPYVDEGLVVLHDWDVPYVPGQKQAYAHSLATYGDEARWIAFFDIDEFLFSPTHRPVSEVLTEYEQWPGVVVNTPRMGPSGRRTKPDGLVIESYLTHLAVGGDRTLKSIGDPAAVEGTRGAHLLSYNRRSAVDEHHYPVHQEVTKVASFERLRMNHYFWKSEEELLWKANHRTAEQEWKERPETRHVPSPSDRRQRGYSFEELTKLEAEFGLRDETILPYAERVREALAKRGGRRAFGVQK